MLSPGDVFILPANLSWRVFFRTSFGNSPRTHYFCTVIACKETGFGTQGRAYSATLLVDGRLLKDCSLKESVLDRFNVTFVHRGE